MGSGLTFKLSLGVLVSTPIFFDTKGTIYSRRRLSMLQYIVQCRNIRRGVCFMSNLEELFRRYYTEELEGRDDLSVYDLFEWSKRDVLLQDYKSGKVLTDMKGLEFPIHYSQNAVDIIASKYFRKAGVNNESGQETSLKMLVHRMVDFWAAALQEEGIIKTQDRKSVV